MNELALFAGAGGGLLASKWLLGWRTVCYIENNPYRIKVLKARIRDGLLDDAPIWGDARMFDGRPWAGSVDIITAGFPCQPFSGAGKGLAERDERNLWPDTIRIVREVRPEWVLLENVSRLLSHAYVRRIFGDLAESGYNVRWDCIPASAIGANHQRDRLWIVAHAQQARRRPKHTRECEMERQDHSIQAEWNQDTSWAPIGSTQVAHTNHNKPHKQKSKIRKANQGAVEGRPQLRARGFDWWATEPDVGRMVDGLAHRVDRLKALGDGQVPAVVRAVWRLLGERGKK